MRPEANRFIFCFRELEPKAEFRELEPKAALTSDEEEDIVVAATYF